MFRTFSIMVVLMTLLAGVSSMQAQVSYGLEIQEVGTYLPGEEFTLTVNATLGNEGQEYVVEATVPGYGTYNLTAGGACTATGTSVTCSAPYTLSTTGSQEISANLNVVESNSWVENAATDSITVQQQFTTIYLPIIRN
jgi:hypothetical protein